MEADVTAALTLWGRWERMPACDWVPVGLGYSTVGGPRVRGSAPDESWRRVELVPPALVVLVRLAVQGMPAHQYRALRRRYVPLEPSRAMPSRFAQRREKVLLARAERRVAHELRRLRAVA